MVKIAYQLIYLFMKIYPLKHLNHNFFVSALMRDKLVLFKELRPSFITSSRSISMIAISTIILATNVKSDLSSSETSFLLFRSTILFARLFSYIVLNS